ncbi:MAG: hypothetical protein IPP71_12205 [Bacteroidetes bacterium]|nr:hypothetical protein [Bacteroidota bacterium]
MKCITNLFAISVFVLAFSYGSIAQTAKTPGSCKMYMDEKVVLEITLEDAVKWCDLEPPTVQCDDGKIYKLETFHINYLTLKPFLNREFGIGEGGFPIRAKEAIKAGQSGDTIILKEVTYTDASGNKNTLPIISLKIK